MSIALTQLKQLQIQAGRGRIDSAETALDVAAGVWRPSSGELMPPPRNAARSEAWDRALAQTQSVGPQIFEKKVPSIIGSISADSEDLQELLTAIDLRSLSRRLLETYLAIGVMACVAHDTEGNGPTITRLGGVVEPITDAANTDRVIGLYRTWQELPHSFIPTNLNTKSSFDDADSRNVLTNDGGSWSVEVWDWSEDATGALSKRTLWRGLEDPTELQNNPTSVDENTSRPRYRVRSWTADGLAIGEIERALPTIKALWATDARLVLAEELAGYPMLLALGGVDVDGESSSRAVVGPGEVWTGTKDATVEWLEPGNLKELREERNMRAERVRMDVNLPGGFLGTATPSGEALKEANLSAQLSNNAYARDLSELLTEVTTDLANLAGGTIGGVSVQPHKQKDYLAEVDIAIKLFQEGIVPLSVTVNKVKALYPTWSDEDVIEWITSQSQIIDPDTFLTSG
jgi:hypothetical protein